MGAAAAVQLASSPMEEPARTKQTADLQAACSGSEDAKARFLQHGYDELRRIAEREVARWNRARTQTPTDVLHEAVVRLLGRPEVMVEGSGFFYVSFATECRRVLVDRYRHRRAGKRGGGMQKVTLHAELLEAEGGAFDLLDLHEAIEELARRDAREAAIVDMRVFAGLSVDECAKALGVSKRTVEGDWTDARSWLRHRLQG